MAQSLSQSVRGRCALIALAVLSLVAALIVVPAVHNQAHAVQTEGFTVSNIKVENPVGSNVRDNNAKTTFKWSAAGLKRVAKPGEGFELELPPELEIAANAQSDQALKYESKKVGTCTFSSRKVSCTFDEGVNQFQHKNDMSGDVEFDSIAVQNNPYRVAYTKDTIPFTFNGQPVDGAIPGGINAAKQAEYKEIPFGKGSTPIGAVSTEIPWLMNFNPTQLHRAFPNTFIQPDGQNNFTMTITDTVGDGYDLAAFENREVSLVETTSKENPGNTSGSAINNSKNTGSRKDFKVEVAYSGPTRTITLTGPFKADANYRLFVPSPLVGNARSGVSYTNNASVNGTDISSNPSVSFTNSAKVTITMRDGFGAVALTKVVQGDAAASIPADTKFTIKMNYTLPENKTPEQFADWGNDKPEQVAPGQNQGQVSLEIPVGQQTPFPKLFPSGTVLTLAEDLPTVNGVVFDASKIEFKENNQVVTQITIASQKMSEVTVRNWADRAKVPFNISKKVVAPQGFQAPAHVTATYQCGDAPAAQVQVPTNNSPVKVGEFPVGTSCAVTAESAAEVAGFKATAEGLNQPVVLGTDAAANTAVITNTYVAKTGSLALSKKVVAQDGVVVPADKNFEFALTCTKDGAEVKNEPKVVVGQQASTVIAGIPAGAECRVVEDETKALDGVDNALLKVTAPAAVTVEADQVAQLAVTNTYSKAISSFTIEKKLNDQAPAAASTKAFTFNVACTKDNQPVAIDPVTITGAGSATVNAPVGAQCTVTEDEAEIEGYTHTNSIEGGTFTVSATPNAVVATNTYIKDVGNFDITKKLVDPDQVATGKTFTFTYTCTNTVVELSENEKSGTFSLKAGETHTLSNLPAGTNCQIAETGAEVDGANLTTSGLDSVTIVKGATQQAEVTNTYAAWRGELTVGKTLSGTAANLDSVKALSFDVEYRCELGGKEVASGTVSVAAGAKKAVSDLRSGATCTLTEKKESITAPEGVVFNAAKSTMAATVTVGADKSNVDVALNNHFDQLGKVAVEKKVAGLAAGIQDNSSREFEFEFSYVDGDGKDVTKELKVAHAQVVELPALPAGTTVVLKEKAAANGALTSWSTPEFSSPTAGVVVDRGDGSAVITVPADSFATPAKVLVTNKANIPWWWLLVPLIPLVVAPAFALIPGGQEKVSPVVPGTPAPAESQVAAQTPSKGMAKSAPAPAQQAPKSGLANTGASVLGLLAVALVVIAGGVLLIRRGRTQR
ncbi:DUF5979 domain-containing protein [Corynebacterium felinum]|uniref:T surface-antigen of pili n=1 Tax=Corynebacterium felinum TaxID=131318 RepID=A0ABU2BAF9_9CORY|nr:DUF5979 domain-containing protein [Corynebacterium felinum]MDF5820988.1 DUF5979 domain-containing protein [Corynebacterium felinum]MDR7354733.1 hypothetical protein [Corynebacterium felinum]WJY94096.1 T surface-antigen of pili [Corynebacterium felinum]